MAGDLRSLVLVRKFYPRHITRLSDIFYYLCRQLVAIVYVHHQRVIGRILLIYSVNAVTDLDRDETIHANDRSAQLSQMVLPRYQNPHRKYCDAGMFGC